MEAVGREPESEEAIAARMLRGDPEAFSLLYERYFPRVYDLAFRMLGDPDLALDVAQETFIKFLERRPRQPPRHFRAYLYTMARHQIHDVLRRSRRELPLPEERPEGPAARREEGPEEQILQQERAALLQELWRALPEEEATLLDLHLRHGLSPAELARVFNRSPGAIHTRLSRARDHLEESFAAWLLLRVGRSACPALAAMLGGPEGAPPPLTPDLRRQLRRHLEGCARCQETRRRYGAAAEWLGAVGMLPPPPEPARAARERLLRQLPSVAAAGALAGGVARFGGVLGRAVQIAVAVGLGGVGLWVGLAAWGSVTVQVENRNCPSLTSPPPLVALSRWWPNLEVPAAVGPGESRRMRLPPVVVTLYSAPDGIRVEAYGMAFKFPVEGLERAEWDGGELPAGGARVPLGRGESHHLRLSCRP